MTDRYVTLVYTNNNNNNIEKPTYLIYYSHHTARTHLTNLVEETDHLQCKV